MLGALATFTRRVVLGAVVLVPLAYDPHGFDTPGIKSLVLTLGGIALLLLGGLAVLGGQTSARRPRAPELLLLALTAWAAFSIGWAVNAQLAETRTLALLGMCGVAAAARDLVPDSAGVRRWLLALLTVGCAAVAIDAVAVVRESADLPDSIRKYASILFVHNNMASSYVILLVPLIAALTLVSRGVGRFVGLAALAGLVGYLLLLRSRAGLAGAALGLALVGLLYVGRARMRAIQSHKLGWSVGIVALVLLGALLPLSERARGLAKDGFYRGVNLIGLDVWDSQFRPRLWAKTIEMVKQDPVRGVGAGNFPVNYARYERQKIAKPHAHNDELQVLAELGLPGLVLFLGLLAALAGALVHRLASTEDPADWSLAAGMTGSLAVFVAGGIFEVPFALAATATHLALLIGLSAALGRATPAAASGPATRVPLGLLMLLVAVPALLMTLRRAPGSELRAEAEQHREAGRLEQAFESYQAVAALGTGSAVPHREAGLIALQLGDGERALEQFGAARALWPFGKEYGEYEGDALMLLERYDEAVDAYHEAVLGHPSRSAPLFKQAAALERADRPYEAIELLTHEIRADPQNIGADVFWQLALVWRRVADELEGRGEGTTEECVRALVVARHFHAVFLQDGEPSQREAVNESYKHVTHRLQLLAGSPDSWWKTTYQDFLDDGWPMPATALYSSMDEDGVKLYPGWHEPEGPPPPRTMRY